MVYEDTPNDLDIISIILSRNGIILGFRFFIDVAHGGRVEHCFTSTAVFFGLVEFRGCFSGYFLIGLN